MTNEIENMPGTDLIALIQIKDFDKSFRKKWMIEESGWDFMKKGWTTWTSVEAMEEAQEDGLLVLEDNEYEINFPRDHFRVLEDNEKM